MSTVLMALVDKIIKDPGFRKTFIAQPRETLNAYVISPAEHRALIRAQQRLLLAGSAREVPYNLGEWP
jgi:hypothetical protein